MEYDYAATRIGQLHFHVRVGPDEVDDYNVLEVPYAGPYYDIIVDDVEDAACMWIDMIDTHLEGLLTEDEEDVLYEDIIESAGWEEPGCFGFELSDLGFILRLDECYGCIPKHNN